MGAIAPNLLNKTTTHYVATGLFFLFGLRSVYDQTVGYGMTERVRVRGGGEGAERAHVVVVVEDERKRRKRRKDRSRDENENESEETKPGE